jgi:serine protease Do
MKFRQSLSFSKLTVVVLAGFLLWGFKSGALLWADPRLTGYRPPVKAPVANVHPEVFNLQSSFASVADSVKPAVVSISTVHIEEIQQAPQFFFGDPFEHFFDFYGQQQMPQRRGSAPMQPRRFKAEGVGSGVIIDPDGLVLTNEHVVRGADEIKVVLYDKENKKSEYIGKVIGKDARTDLAIVKIKARGKLPFAALGDSENVKVGDWAIAIGSPFGLSQTMTVGVISAARQSLAIEDREYRNMIQTDAAINRGNSGGPLINIKGEVVGINTAIYAPTGTFAGIGFAVPINQAKEILNDLINKGHVVRGWLGVELGREITPAMVKQFGLSDSKGALVNRVLKDSPAEKSGLKRGDVIRSVNGQVIDSSDKLQSLVAQLPPKKKVDLEVVRDRKTVRLSLVMGERPESADTGKESAAPAEPTDEKGKEKSWQGARMAPLTDVLAQNFRQPLDAPGVMVVDIENNSVAEEMGLQPGDVILGINQDPTPDLSTFNRVSSRVKISDGIVLDVLRQGRPLYLSFTKQ